MTASEQLDLFENDLTALRTHPERAASLAQATRQGSDVLLQALPPRYSEVLHNLLDRLESSALFAEESCSFSHKDLLDSLQMWADKARGQLG